MAKSTVELIPAEAELLIKFMASAKLSETPEGVDPRELLELFNHLRFRLSMTKGK